MRSERQNAIIQLIKEEPIETQTDLTLRLREMGFEVTQATVSRDVKELRLIKTMGENGQYRYAQSAVPDNQDVTGRLNLIFSRSVVDIDSAQNIVVVKTLPGMGQAAAAALDATSITDIVGTIAGDDTVFAAVRNNEEARILVQKLRDVVNSY